jgi:heme-degrading monooxygenase HmoA
MFARVETFQAASDEMDDLIGAQQKTVGLARQLPGNMGGFLLVNRETGKALSVTYWESESDRSTAEAEFAAAQQRGEVELYAIATQRAMTDA